jgi:DNA-binding transcriptional regulator YdaS (Cro superfamily)
MKKTHKLRGLSNVDQVVADAPSLVEAAHRLGVDRSTLWRWIKAGKVLAPRHWPAPASAAAREVYAAAVSQGVDGWATEVRAGRMCSPTDERLIDLAAETLRLATDSKTAPTTRLTAMGRFQQLVRQLRLDSEADAPSVPERRPQATPRVGADPRRMLMAVK